LRAFHSTVKPSRRPEIGTLGGGVAGGWQRGASMVGPLVVGAILPAWGLNSVFVVFGVVALVGASICAAFATETRGQALEKVSPPP
jgi:putative MFS transporter